METPIYSRPPVEITPGRAVFGDVAFSLRHVAIVSHDEHKDERIPLAITVRAVGCACVGLLGLLIGSLLLEDSAGAGILFIGCGAAGAAGAVAFIARPWPRRRRYTV